MSGTRLPAELSPVGEAPAAESASADDAPAAPLPPVSTVAEAAKYLRINPKTVYAEIAAGRIHVLRFGRSLRIPRAFLEALCAGKARAGR